MTAVEESLPYLDAVARRPYSQGLHAAWDLQPGERVLLFVDNWYDPLCLEATEQFGGDNYCPSAEIGVTGLTLYTGSIH